MLVGYSENDVTVEKYLVALEDELHVYYADYRLNKDKMENHYIPEMRLTPYYIGGKLDVRDVNNDKIIFTFRNLDGSYQYPSLTD